MIDVRRAVAGSVVFGLLVVGGCSGEDEPGTPVELPSLSPSVEQPSEARFEPSPAPERPAEGWPEEQSSAEVTPEEVARAWFDAYNDALLSGDTTRMRAMFIEGCGTCEALADQVERFYGAGGGMRFAETPYTPSNFEVMNADAESTTLSFDLAIAAGESASSSDAEVVTFDAEQERWAIAIRERSGRLLLEQIGEIQ
ncbi:hypothetical protein [Nocardioides sp. AE5]|uniref:hypothetical protein n=1 Tax=Nocardioides sp. AE5 TaxID=2962573 RepID=UPI002882BFA7|nr:hypothetical protein [Nocardioides sp. AE5]MDT0203001.1 hypothetical protein [Nocardioides sp. AE5]